MRRSSRAPLAPASPGCRIVHGDSVADELHQIFIGRDDQHVGAALARLARIGRDEIVGFVSVLFDRHEAEGTDSRPH